MEALQRLGAMHAASFASDPKHLGFVLARYHFVARMLQGKRCALEVGCGDGTGARIVKATGIDLYGIDREPQPDYPGPFAQKDIIKDGESLIHLAWHGLDNGMDAVFALDVMEHIDVLQENAFIGNMKFFLRDDNGVCIIGMPSKESQPYASELSRKYHVNCKTEDELRATMQQHFANVFMFGMQDATLHTGFGPMTHYRLALCTGKRE
jgi:cyclopropane fatty-acyl-phospholipid synthase-like methyltransferase